MKLLTFIFICFLFLNCNHGYSDDNLAEVKGLSLYMCHDVFGEDGRRLTMAFSETQQFEKLYKLELQYKIVDKKIIISVIDKTEIKNRNNGFHDNLHTPRGHMFIPDSLLLKGNYSLEIRTANFQVKSKLKVTNDVIELKIPNNKYFSCRINKVYPIPKDLLFGSVIFYGEKDNKVIAKFFEEFEKLGVTKTTLPNYPYKHLTVDDSGRPIGKFYPDGQNVLRFLYKMDTDFREAAKFMKKWYWKYHPSIYFGFYSSNGDQALALDKDGINTFFSDE